MFQRIFSFLKEYIMLVSDVFFLIPWRSLIFQLATPSTCRFIPKILKFLHSACFLYLPNFPGHQSPYTLFSPYFHSLFTVSKILSDECIHFVYQKIYIYKHSITQIYSSIMNFNKLIMK